MNKQSIGKRVPFFDGDDIAVAEILIQLPELISQYSYPSFGWGAKRRRSAISQQQPPSSSVAAEAKSNAVAVSATSPATPLMFSPSESDENKTNTHSTVSFLKRKLQNKDELMQSLTELTHQKDSLVKEMEAVKRNHDILRASNLELKHRKQLIYGFSPLPLQTTKQQQQVHYPFQLQQHPSMQWSTDKMAPVGLPDLNLTLEEVAAANAGNMEVVGYQADVMMVMDYNVNNNKALASAQARKRRMHIYKEKSQNQILRHR